MLECGCRYGGTHEAELADIVRGSHLSLLIGREEMPVMPKPPDDYFTQTSGQAGRGRGRIHDYLLPSLQGQRVSTQNFARLKAVQSAGRRRQPD